MGKCSDPRAACINPTAACINPRAACSNPRTACSSPRAPCSSHRAACSSPTACCNSPAALCSNHKTMCSSLWSLHNSLRAVNNTLKATCSFHRATYSSPRELRQGRLLGPAPALLSSSLEIRPCQSAMWHKVGHLSDSDHAFSTRRFSVCMSMAILTVVNHAYSAPNVNKQPTTLAAACFADGLMQELHATPGDGRFYNRVSASTM